MKHGRSLKRMTQKQLAKARSKQSILDTEYTTVTGEVKTIRDLQAKMKRANQRLYRAKSYVTNKEYKSLESKYETSLLITNAFKSGTKRYSVSALKKTTPAKLRLVDAAVSTALASSYMTKHTYKAIDEKRYQSYLESEYVNNREQYEMLRDFFSSESWKQLHDAGVISSDQLVRILKDEVFEMGADADKSKKIQIQELLQTYADAMVYRDMAKPSYTRYKVEEAELTIPDTSDWDDLVNYEYETPNPEAVRIAGAKTQDEFYKLMREDLLKIVGGA